MDKVSQRVLMVLGAATVCVVAALMWPSFVGHRAGPQNSATPETTGHAADNAVEPTPTEPEKPKTFEEVYGLQGMPAKRVPRPYGPAREEQLRKAGLWHEDNTDGPGSMVVEWKPEGPWIRTATWGGKPGEPGITLDELLNHLLGYRDMDIDAPNPLKYMIISGDIVFDTAATRPERIAALEQIAWEANRKRISIREVEVEQRVIVLKGQWNYKPIEGLPWGQEKDAPQTIELFGADLDKELKGRQGFGNGTPGQFAACLSYFIQQDVTIEATGAPNELRWFYNYHGDGTQQSAAQAHDLELTLKHVCEQTGLSRSESTRTARRVKIEDSRGELLP